MYFPYLERSEKTRNNFKLVKSPESLDIRDTMGWKAMYILASGVNITTFSRRNTQREYRFRPAAQPAIFRKKDILITTQNFVQLGQSGGEKGIQGEKEPNF